MVLEEGYLRLLRQGSWAGHIVLLGAKEKERLGYHFSGSRTGASPGDQQGAHKGRRPRQEPSEGLRKVWAEGCGSHQGLWTEPRWEVPIACLRLESTQVLLAGWHRERRSQLNFKTGLWCLFFLGMHLRRNYPPPPPTPLRLWICWAVYTILIFRKGQKGQLSL